MDTMNKPINYPYAYGNLCVSMHGIAAKAYLKALDLDIPYEQATELKDCIQSYIQELEDESRERGARAYVRD